MRIIFALALSLSPLAHAQFGKSEVEGRITGEAGVPIERLQVVLRSPTTRATYQSWVRSNGEFSFGKVEDGTYHLEVLAQNGDVVVSDLTSVPTRMSLTVALPEVARRQEPVSIHRLTHAAPRASVDAFKKAARAEASNNEAEAMRYLDRALEIDPDFTDALHRRGLLAFSNREFQAAFRLLSKAAKLDSASAAIQSDAAMAGYADGQYAECERFAAAALRLAPVDPKPNYLIALALLKQGRPPEQAVPHLERAAPVFPRATEILERIRQFQKQASTLK